MVSIIYGYEPVQSNATQLADLVSKQLGSLWFSIPVCTVTRSYPVYNLIIYNLARDILYMVISDLPSGSYSLSRWLHQSQRRYFPAGCGHEAEPTFGYHCGVLKWGYPQIQVMDDHFSIKTHCFGDPQFHNHPNIYIYKYKYTYIHTYIHA